MAFDLKAPEELLKYHPQVTGVGLLVVSSIGKFKYNGTSYPFDNSLDKITSQIYLHLLCNYSENDLQEIYFDVSSGQNIYIAALLSAGYRFLPFVQFKRFFHSLNNKVDAFLLNSDPILGKPEYAINIKKSKFSARAFNSFPYKNVEKVKRMIKLIFRNEKYCNNLEKLLCFDYFLLHGALIFGAPMMITIADKTILKNIFDEVGINAIINKIRNYFSHSNMSESKVIAAEDVYACTFALAICQSIYFQFKEIIQEGEACFMVKKNKENNFSFVLEEFKQAFDHLKRIYGQPLPNYVGEIKKAVEPFYIDKVKCLPEGYASIVKLIEINNSDYKPNRNFNPRNFFAHGGLEMNITEVKIVENKVIVRYNKEIAGQYRESIVKYLKK